MTSTEFNEKYKDYKERGFYGLSIDIPIVTDYLDKEFEGFVEKYGNDFRFSQIKLKFNMSRVYIDPKEIDSSKMEQTINSLIKIDDRNRKIDEALS